ncbi:hypothetical protein PGTUg99_028683 [Puccinia graminis f. sp. tritici]|uniref:Uncharacterized protein n=1 Tax=Puccinia graminis f. sp. tritici TaxID=56615 RepID=A0A5B0QSS6_PUCGR|nr:hypothetical protein PGTUg99_028683 [Puccinia graminis f. sp. tritici]
MASSQVIPPETNHHMDENQHVDTSAEESDTPANSTTHREQVLTDEDQYLDEQSCRLPKEPIHERPLIDTDIDELDEDRQSDCLLDDLEGEHISPEINDEMADDRHSDCLSDDSEGEHISPPTNNEMDEDRHSNRSSDDSEGEHISPQTDDEMDEDQQSVMSVENHLSEGGTRHAESKAHYTHGLRRSLRTRSQHLNGCVRPRNHFCSPESEHDSDAERASSGKAQRRDATARCSSEEDKYIPTGEDELDSNRDNHSAIEEDITPRVPEEPWLVGNHVPMAISSDRDEDKTDYKEALLKNRKRGRKHCKIMAVPWRSSKMTQIFIQLDEISAHQRDISFSKPSGPPPRV